MRSILLEEIALGGVPYLGSWYSTGCGLDIEGAPPQNHARLLQLCNESVRKSPGATAVILRNIDKLKAAGLL